MTILKDDMPNRNQLWMFIAKFAGHNHVKFRRHKDGLWAIKILGQGSKGPIKDIYQVPNYLESLDAWLRDVWPKIKPNQDLVDSWVYEVYFSPLNPQHDTHLNASAYVRCLALYDALEGVLL